MFLSDLSIKQPVLITMLMLALVVVGVLAFTAMPVDFFPDISFPVVAVVTVYPGASPAEVESQLSRPIENAMVTIPGVEDVQSQSSESLSVVLITFNLDRKAALAAQDVREKLSNVRSSLPDDIKEPGVNLFDPAALPVMSIAVAGQSGAVATGDIRQLVVDDILPRLQRVEGVADATVVGGREREIQVFLDAAALNARRVPPQQVIQTIIAESLGIPGGGIERGEQNLLLRTPGNFQRVADIANLQIAGPMGAVRVGDLAEVLDGVKTPVELSRLNGQDAVVAAIRKQSGSNTVQVAERVRRELATLQGERPDLKFTVVRDQSVFVQESLNDALFELLIGALMASLVVFIFFRDLRNTLVTVAGLPVIVIGSFAVMSALGITLNIVSLLALALSVGLIIDDAIVVRENIFRHMERGESPRVAASRGTAEVALPVLAMTLTIVSVFLPVAFTGGLIGRFFRSFGLVVSMAVLLSLFEAFTFAPMLSAYFFKQKQVARVIEDDDPLAGGHNALGWLDRQYHRLLGWTLKHKLATAVIGVAVFAVSLFGASFLKPIFIPQIDTGNVDMALALPPGTRLGRTDVVARQAEARLLARPDVEAVLASIGGRGTPEQASFYVKLESGHTANAFIASARRELADVPGLVINPPGFQSISGGSAAASSVLGKPVQVTLQTVGNADELNQFALKLAELLRQVPGLADVDVSYKPGKPEMLVVVDRKRAADLGVNIATVGSTVRTLVEGSEVAIFRGEGPEANIRVQLRPEDRERIEQVLDLPVPTARGLIALRQVARLEEASGPTQLTRLNRQRAVVIGANTFGRDQADVVADATQVIEAAQFPTGITYEFTGEQKLQAESFSALGFAMLLAVVFVYMVLASQFGSFIQPFVIMLALPLAIIGALLALLATGRPLDMTSIIGMILLLGLVTKNSILLVDLTNRLRRQRGLSRDQALLIAGPTRLRPILMTTLALILGMLPVAIGLGTGSDFRRPMAIAIIGGLITSTILTLVIVPTAYTIVEGVMERMQRRRGAARGKPLVERAAAAEDAA